MNALFGAGALLFGSIIGSFLNVLLIRWDTGEGVGGRSRCRSCTATLEPRDLVPIVSYLFLRGRCRMCRARVSPQYPLVEMAAALIALGVFFTHPSPFPFFFWFFAWMLFLFLAAYDLRHQLLPVEALGALAALAFLSLFIRCAGSCYLAAAPLGALLSGPLIALPFLALSALSGGRWMGWGDGYLAVSIGWILGFSDAAAALLLAFWTGAIVGLALVWVSSWRAARASRTMDDVSRRSERGEKIHAAVTLQSRMPLGPFLIFGAAIVFFFHVTLFSILSFF